MIESFTLNFQAFSNLSEREVIQSTGNLLNVKRAWDFWNSDNCHRLPWANDISCLGKFMKNKVWREFMLTVYKACINNLMKAIATFTGNLWMAKTGLNPRSSSLLYIMITINIFGRGGVHPMIAHTGRIRPKGVFFQASGIWKGRDFTSWKDTTTSLKDTTFTAG